MKIEGKNSILLASFLLVNIAFKINAVPTIPTEAAELDKWFEEAIKPPGQQGSLEPNVVEAENGAAEIITVRQDGSGKYRTVADAIKHVKVGNRKRIIISIGPGEYREKLKVERFQAYITMVASDPAKRPTIVYAGRAAQYGTMDSASIIVEADYFVASNIIFSNAAPQPKQGEQGGQAVALRISGDKAAFYNCKFVGFQDTLCDDKGNHLFKDCFIEGAADFIFGAAKSLYLNCEIHVLATYNDAFITAHGRKNTNEVSGYAFIHCKITGTGGPIGYLGRAWFEAAKVVFLHSELGDIIRPEGWSDHFRPEVQKTVYFGEFGNKGPGGATTKRVPYTKILTPTEAATYMTLDYIDALKWLTPPPKL